MGGKADTEQKITGIHAGSNTKRLHTKLIDTADIW